jgi:antitoxin component YwqK of YwqJK toxin-antitoxin module
MGSEPTNIDYYENGKIKSKHWIVNGNRHNENGPAIIWYYENGKIKSQIWYVNGILHNENEPSHIHYYENGKIKSQIWRINEKRHNENGPAFISYYENGQIKYQYWCTNGLFQNENGPSYIDYYENGQIQSQEWYINGEELSEQEILIQKELIEKRKIAINVIWKNWLISKWNWKYREFLTQILTVPENHDSLVGKLFPNGGYDYKKFKESLLTF